MKRKNMERMQKLSIFDKLQLSPSELTQFGIAWFIFIMAFVPQAILASFLVFTGDTSVLSAEFMARVSLMAFAIGAAFMFHELGHKFAAQRFKARAEFRLDRQGLLISAVSMALGFYLMVPGAVFWQSNLAKYDNVRGRVSASGPIINLLLASISLGLIGLGQGSTVLSPGWILLTFGEVSFFLNVYLGLFNLLPVWIIDGKKILQWNESVWLTLVILFTSLIFAGFYAFEIKFYFFFFEFPPF